MARLVRATHCAFENVRTSGVAAASVRRLVWIEWHDSIEAAIHREKRLKKYKREWKINLIERENREWLDLFPHFFREEGPLSHLQQPVPST